MESYTLNWPILDADCVFFLSFVSVAYTLSIHSFIHTYTYLTDINYYLHTRLCARWWV